MCYDHTCIHFLFLYYKYLTFSGDKKKSTADKHDKHDKYYYIKIFTPGKLVNILIKAQSYVHLFIYFFTFS